MPNRRFNKMAPSQTSPPVQTRQPEPVVSINETTANWPSVPGKTQSRNRSNGTVKLKIHPKQQGL